MQFWTILIENQYVKKNKYYKQRELYYSHELIATREWLINQFKKGIFGQPKVYILEVWHLTRSLFIALCLNKSYEIALSYISICCMQYFRNLYVTLFSGKAQLSLKEKFNFWWQKNIRGSATYWPDTVAIAMGNYTKITWGCQL